MVVKLFSDSWRDTMKISEFREVSKEWILKPKSTWNHITILAYFYNKYYNCYGAYFKFANWKGFPAKTKECRDLSKLLKKFYSEDFSYFTKEQQKADKEKAIRKCYNYINWIFDYKFKQRQYYVTGTLIFLKPSLINEFERMYKAFLLKSKKQSNFNNIKKWIQDNYPDFLNNFSFEDEKDLKIICEFLQENFKPGDSEYVISKKIKEML